MQPPAADLIAVLEQAPSGCVLLDDAGILRYGNPAASLMMGMDATSLIGRDVFDLIPTLRVNVFGEAVRTAARERRVVQLTALADTFGRWFELRAVPMSGGLAVYFDDVTAREVAKRTLADREEQQDFVLTQVGIGTFDADLVTGRVELSELAGEILGQSARTTAVEDANAGLTPEGLAKMRAAIARAGSAPFREDVMLARQPHEAPRWVRVSARAIPGPGGAPARIVGLFRDVTEERSQADQLARSARDLARAHRLARIGTWSQDLRTGAVSWSAELRLLLALPGDASASLGAMQARFSAEDARRWTAAVERMRATGAPYELELFTTLPDDRPLWVIALGEVVRDDDGVPVEVFGTVQDITGERLQARAIADSELRFRTLAAAAPSGIFLTDANGVPTYANARLLEMFELPFADFIAGQWFDRILAEDRGEVQASAARAIETATPVRIPCRAVTSAGVRHLRVASRPMREASGTVLGHVGTVEDITAEVEATEARLAQQQRDQQAQKLESLGLLAGGIAHDFNNLLVAVLTNASLARLDLPETHPAREVLDDIERAAQRAADLTRQLLAYAGKGQHLVSPLDLSALVAEMAQLLRAAIVRRVGLDLDLAEGLPAVRGDATQLRQVVMNLITNAADACGDAGGTVRLVTRYDPAPRVAAGVRVLGQPLDGRPRIVLEVHDDGHGMRPEVLERIFDPFFSTKFAGRGLGLSATVGILQQHLGAIAVRSDVGRGTTFTLYFPPSPERAVAAEPRVRRPELSGGGTVLVVDDDEGVRQVATTILRRAGFAVEVAENGRDGLARLRANGGALAAVLLDLTMPVMGGAEALAAIRSEFPDLPVVLMSGYVEEDLTGALGGRASAFLQKPFTVEALQETMRRLLPNVGARPA